MSAAFQVFQTTPWLFVTAAVLIGLAVGSFLNVVIHRLPGMLERQWRAECAELTGNPAPAAENFNLVVPRSSCPKCGHRITALENIPLVSYAVLGGKCGACQAPISIRYPVVEALAGALAGYIAWRFGLSLAALGALIFAWTMIALAFIDLDTFYLPDNITLPLLWAGLLFNAGGIFTDLHSAVIGAAAGYLSLRAVCWPYKLATGREGFGYGDLKMFAAIGAWFGWKGCLIAMFVFALVGFVSGIIVTSMYKKAQSTPKSIPTGGIWLVSGTTTMFSRDLWDSLLFG